ncbi:DUF7521 family protein [Halobellus litoreus]|uniref:Uncharacterized protein n=1 Tax=Halobellus litoreus TaxID=755310 RepID=A0ABD6E469_9EURY|nr:hypothetical protein [Halobellus litoreus]
MNTDLLVQAEVTTEVLLQAYEMVGVVLGLFIAYLAFRGYQRNDSRPMLFIALGFSILLGLPAVVFLISLVLPSVSEPTVQILTQTLEIIGLILIIYALRMSP